MTSATPNARSIVLFDGTCAMCSAATAWIARRDVRDRFRFAAVRSRAGQRLLDAAGWRGELPGSIILIEGARVTLRSSAVIAIARRLGFPWSVAVVGLCVPRGLRDWAYAVFARNRHRFMRGRGGCALPTGAERARYLDADEVGASADGA
ncbi:MAG: thiol-disulfide oxidoreductase DCC family protein [Phycisphaerales bacterium]